MDLLGIRPDHNRLCLACHIRVTATITSFVGGEGDGVLVIIGDVSGKGMPAAMTVSLLVGTVRTLAHYTQRPAEILSAMNQRMVSRSQGGFTTCLVLKADADGLVTLANAGHITPYLIGTEVPVEGSLAWAFRPMPCMPSRPSCLPKIRS
jgi:hypothetical protein